MNVRNVIIGAVLIVVSIWFYLALSTFEIEKGSSPERIIIREGIVRSVEEVAIKLSEENGFDLEGAYKSGYRPIDVVLYLINEPHDYPVTFYDGQYYEGRKTVIRIIPVIGCILTGIIGIGLIIPKRKFRGRKGP